MELLQIRTSNLNITQISVWEKKVRFLEGKKNILFSAMSKLVLGSPHFLPNRFWGLFLEKKNGS
jgi:hypothetical protein